MGTTKAETAVSARRSDRWDESSRSLVAFEKAAVTLDLEPWIVQRLRYPLSEFTAYLQWQRDSGDSVCMEMFDVQYGPAAQASVGSLELAPDLQLRDCRALARERTWQAALLDLPFGGSSYALLCDPNELSERELTRLAQLVPQCLQASRYARDTILFPGRGCCREFLGRIFSASRNPRTPVITGKPEALSGLNHDQFIAEGIAAVAAAALRHIGREFIDARVAVQGFNTLAQVISRRLLREGVRVIAMSDASGAVYRAGGLLLDDLCAAPLHGRVLFDYEQAEHITRADLLQLPCDVLVLASGANELQEQSCRGVAAAVVVEAEWNSLTEAASERLSGSEVLVVPWFTATAGALMASWLESRNDQILARPEKLLGTCYQTLSDVMESVLRTSVVNDCTCWDAVYGAAVEKAARYLRNCGIKN